MLVLPEARTLCTELPSKPSFSTGKLDTLGAGSRAPEGQQSKAHLVKHTVSVSPTAPLGGYRLDGMVNGVQISFLVDTGAVVTLLRKDTWERISAADPQELSPWSELQLVGVGGTSLSVHGSASVKIELEGKMFTTNVVVVSPLITMAILGLDVLKQNRASIDVESKQLHLAECSLPLREPELQNGRKRKVKAEKTTEIPPRSVIEVMACIDDPVEPGTMWLLEETTEKRAPTAVARALVQPTSTRVPIRLLNPRTEPLVVYAGMELATLEEADAPVGLVNAIGSGDPPAVGEEKQEMLWRLVEESDPSLSGEEKQMFFNLLLSYADVFSASPNDLGRTGKLRHCINTGDAPPTRQPVRRIPPHRREEVRALLNEMLERRVVEPSTSPWASPIVLVQKKDGSTRFCVDCRKLNDVTRKDAYPLPRIDTTLDTLAGSK